LEKSIPTPTLEEFLECCRQECEFLVIEYSFELLSSPREYNDYTVRFRKGDLEVHTIGENYGKAASCELLRGDDSLYLGFLVPAQERQAPKSKRGSPGQLTQVRTLAAVLKHHAADFLRGDLTRYESALAEWRRISRPRKMTEAHRLERERQQALTAAGHASKGGNHAEVVRLLEPYADTLSRHQSRTLELARQKLAKVGNDDGTAS
jgi:hypothetical protein